MHDELYRRYAPALIRKAVRLLGETSEAEDIVHALFTDLLQGRVPRTDFPYLFRATTHRCLNRLRDDRRRQTLLNEAMPAGPSDHPGDSEMLRAALKELDPKLAEVVAFHYFDDMSQEEVAQLLGLSRKTVGKYLGLAKDKLAQLTRRRE